MSVSKFVPLLRFGMARGSIAAATDRVWPLDINLLHCPGST
jgi:hypothetical protein